MLEAPPLIQPKGPHNGKELGQVEKVQAKSSISTGFLARLACLPASVSAPRDLIPEVACHESEPGHTYHLAQSLQSSDTSSDSGAETFGDTPRVPVPNEVFFSLSDLSGCAVRLAVVLMRESYFWTGSGWKCSARFQTREELGPVGMSAQSVRNAAEELRERGWIERQKRGDAYAYRWRLSVPKKRFTYLPLTLLHDAAKVSHSSLTLLLAVYHATWGQTFRRNGKTLHKSRAALSVSDLCDRTGLCASTIRSAADELIHNGALSRTRTAYTTLRRGEAERGSAYVRPVRFALSRSGETGKPIRLRTYRGNGGDVRTAIERYSERGGLDSGRD